MPYWLVLIIVGVILYIATMAPVFPAAWSRVVQALGGLLVVAGVLILVIALIFGADAVDFRNR